MTLLFLGGGLWIIPLALLGAAAWFGVIAVRKHQSGVNYQDQKTGKWLNTPGKIPYSQIGQFWFAVVFAAAAIGALIWMYSDR